VPLALISVAVGTAAAFPAARHFVSALWNLPDRLPSLAENSQVHFERGAEDYAHDVSALLPAAIARVEAAHGRPFAHPVAAGAYATPAAYAGCKRPGFYHSRGHYVLRSGESVAQAVLVPTLAHPRDPDA